jgi:glucose/arabinose dehydrogenase
MRLAGFNPTLTLLAALVACAGTASSTRNGAAVAAAAAAPGLHASEGFAVETIARIDGARELAALPNGDLLVGTDGSDVYIVTNAEDHPGAPQVFATLDDAWAAGVFYAPGRDEIYVATHHHVWAIPYHGERKAPQIRRIADVRQGPVAPGTDGDIHRTTSVAYAAGRVYAAAGSSCDATMDNGKNPCTEVDPTRAAVSVMGPDGSDFTQRAKRIRNAIALAVNPATGSLWVGGAGQDRLPFGHPYEYLDDLSAHPGDADYGWPECEENHHVYWPGYTCTDAVEPLVELPAYSTIIGATFYPDRESGPYAFPQRYRGGLFVAVHGSWHVKDGCSAEPPRVVFVAMNGDRPAKRVDWNDPTTQWSDFLTGFQSGCTAHIGRPTGIAVGPKGSLFLGDDDAGSVYRVRPAHG